jgi:organic hydroperoxide reductase OsmC/OhrA
MAEREHTYKVSVEWLGNRGTGTSGYRSYGRQHRISAGAKPDIPGSSDPSFLGDAGRWNPEELLVASLSACHKLWYLHLCSDAGISVLSYVDQAEGTMRERGETGVFTAVTLRPKVVIREEDDAALATRLHHVAHERCYIANSVKFPVHCEPQIVMFEVAFELQSELLHDTNRGEILRVGDRDHPGETKPVQGIVQGNLGRFDGEALTPVRASQPPANLWIGVVLPHPKTAKADQF